MNNEETFRQALVEAFGDFGTLWPKRDGHYDLTYAPDALALLQNDESFAVSRPSDPHRLADEIVNAAAIASPYAIDAYDEGTMKISVAIVNLGEAIGITFKE